MNEPLHIIVDTREQRAWSYPESLARTTRGTLACADYRLAGDTGFAIERKSLDDFIGTITSGWDRFERELDRMDDAKFPAKIILVEGTVSDILREDYNHHRVKPKLVLKKIAILTLSGVSILFTSNAHEAAGVALSIFWERAKYLEESR